VVITRSPEAQSIGNLIIKIEGGEKEVGKRAATPRTRNRSSLWSPFRNTVFPLGEEISKNPRG